MESLQEIRSREDEIEQKDDMKVMTIGRVWR